MNKEDILDQIGELAEKLDNALIATSLPVSNDIHVKGMKGTMTEVKSDLIRLYGELGGDVEELNVE